MNIDCSTYNCIEDFVLDSNFLSWINKAHDNEIMQLKMFYPDKKELIEKVIIFCKYVNIEQVEVSTKQINEDWKKLYSEIIAREQQEKKRKKRKLGYIISAAAACLAIIFSTYLYINYSTNLSLTDEKQSLFSKLDEVDITSGEVQIVAGGSQTIIGNEETIIQTEKGDLLVGNESKLESSSIDTEYLTVIVPKGRRTTLKFSDGTTAWVNSGSKLIYPKVFGEKSRDVTIDGEIYLEVSPNKDKPFYVHTKGFEVEVLGTKFNVNAYSDDPKNSVVLVEGSVEVLANNTKNRLEPNQAFISGSNLYTVKTVDVYPYISWTEGIMKLGGESLSEIIKRLSRYYGIEIYYNEKFGMERYAGKLNMKDSIEYALYNLSLSTPFKYTKRDNAIYITQ
ncbi:MAG TPA: hypothetical protein DIT04_08255 [Dysgonomonas sp.]|nr:hypothetical protein [Dysgonomonas sp.]